MDIAALLADKSIKPKEKTTMLSTHLLNGTITVKELMAFASSAKDSPMATCIEALEFATKQQPQLATTECIPFLVTALAHKAPRVKWESAKVMGNIAHLYPAKLDKAIVALLVNTEDTGTVVRWSAAYALGEILKLNTKHNKELIPAIEAVTQREEKNSIKKVYLVALKAIK